MDMENSSRLMDLLKMESSRTTISMAKVIRNGLMEEDT